MGWWKSVTDMPIPRYCFFYVLHSTYYILVSHVPTHAPLNHEEFSCVLCPAFRLYFIFPACHPGPILIPPEERSFLTSSDPHFGQVSLIVSISFTLRTLSKVCSHLLHWNSYRGMDSPPCGNLQFQVSSTVADAIRPASDFVLRASPVALPSQVELRRTRGRTRVPGSS